MHEGRDPAGAARPQTVGVFDDVRKKKVLFRPFDVRERRRHTEKKKKKSDPSESGPLQPDRTAEGPPNT